MVIFFYIFAAVGRVFTIIRRFRKGGTYFFGAFQNLKPRHSLVVKYIWQRKYIDAICNVKGTKCHWSCSSCYSSSIYQLSPLQLHPRTGDKLLEIRVRWSRPLGPVVMRQGRGSEATERFFAYRQKSLFIVRPFFVFRARKRLHAGLRTGCHYSISRSVCPSVRLSVCVSVSVCVTFVVLN